MIDQGELLAFARIVADRAELHLLCRCPICLIECKLERGFPRSASRVVTIRVPEFDSPVPFCRVFRRRLLGKDGNCYRFIILPRFREGHGVRIVVPAFLLRETGRQSGDVFRDRRNAAGFGDDDERLVVVRDVRGNAVHFDAIVHLVCTFDVVQNDPAVSSQIVADHRDRRIRRTAADKEGIAAQAAVDLRNQVGVCRKNKVAVIPLGPVHLEFFDIDVGDVQASAKDTLVSDHEIIAEFRADDDDRIHSVAAVDADRSINRIPDRIGTRVTLHVCPGPLAVLGAGKRKRPDGKRIVAVAAVQGQYRLVMEHDELVVPLAPVDRHGRGNPVGKPPSGDLDRSEDVIIGNVCRCVVCGPLRLENLADLEAVVADAAVDGKDHEGVIGGHIVVAIQGVEGDPLNAPVVETLDRRAVLVQFGDKTRIGRRLVGKRHGPQQEHVIFRRAVDSDFIDAACAGIVNPRKLIRITSAGVDKVQISIALAVEIHDIVPTVQLINGNVVFTRVTEHLDVASEGVGSLSVEENHVIVGLPEDIYLGGVEASVEGYVGADPGVGVAVIPLHGDLGSGLHKASGGQVKVVPGPQGHGDAADLTLVQAVVHDVHHEIVTRARVHGREDHIGKQRYDILADRHGTHGPDYDIIAGGQPHGGRDPTDGQATCVVDENPTGTTVTLHEGQGGLQGIIRGADASSRVQHGIGSDDVLHSNGLDNVVEDGTLRGIHFNIGGRTQKA